MNIEKSGGGPLPDNHTEINPETGQQRAYVVLSKEERAKGFVRPVRRSYIHNPCGTLTTMAQDIAETYARNPKFYSGTFCVGCKAHYPLNEFTWDGTNERMGSDIEVKDEPVLPSPAPLRDLIAEAESLALNHGGIVFHKPVPDNLLTVFDNSQREVVKIMADGKLYWLGKEIETDAEFLSAAKEIMARLFNLPPFPVTEAMVSRFLSMPLPRTFSPDGGISFDRRKDQWNPNPSWPVGTNLFSAEEIRAILEHVINGG